MDTTDERRVRNKARRQGCLIKKLRQFDDSYFLVDADRNMIIGGDNHGVGHTLADIEEYLKEALKEAREEDDYLQRRAGGKEGS